MNFWLIYKYSKYLYCNIEVWTDIVIHLLLYRKEYNIGI